jgi:hypothetical protein
MASKVAVMRCWSLMLVSWFMYSAGACCGRSRHSDVTELCAALAFSPM